MFLQVKDIITLIILISWCLYLIILKIVIVIISTRYFCLFTCHWSGYWIFFCSNKFWRLALWNFWRSCSSILIIVFLIFFEWLIKWRKIIVTIVVYYLNRVPIYIKIDWFSVLQPYLFSIRASFKIFLLRPQMTIESHPRQCRFPVFYLSLRQLRPIKGHLSHDSFQYISPILRWHL